MEKVIIQGHRGLRSQWPENTLIGIEKCLESGVHAVEIDVVVTRDLKVIVCHDPSYNPTIHQHETATTNFHFFEHDLHEIQAIDAGIKTNPLFPNQQSINQQIPTLLELLKWFELIDSRAFVNIEVKSRPDWYSKLQPDPINYAQIISEALRHFTHLNLQIQSFDPLFLNAFNTLNPHLKIVQLFEPQTYNSAHPFEHLEFKPFGVGMHYSLITETEIQRYIKMGIHIAGWTLNNKEDVLEKLSLGLRDITTDFPIEVAKWVADTGYEIAYF